jgi:putative FmdB family regulatory protein
VLDERPVHAALLALVRCECQEDDVPTYQYACTACGHQLEAVQSFADDPLTECPTCEGRLRKLFSSVGVVFKGSGFYRTDSRAAASDSGAREGGAKENAAKDTGAKDGSAGKDGKKESTSSAKETSATPAKKDSAPAAAA